MAACECPICFESKIQNQMYIPLKKEGTRLVAACGKVFHAVCKDCFVEHIKRLKKNGRTLSCTICRQSYDEIGPIPEDRPLTPQQKYYKILESSTSEAELNRIFEIIKQIPNALIYLQAIADYLPPRKNLSEYKMMFRHLGVKIF